MDKAKALQKLLGGTATKKEIEILRQALANGEISIGGDVNRSVVIIGSGNKVELTAEALGILKPETAEEPVSGESPYMGLRYFDTVDASLFFGREELTRKLVERVKKESFLAIVGASGSGKSSVARAGLIPAWKKENERGNIHVITPTEHPLESLAVSLTRESESITATSTLMDDMQKDARSLRLHIKKMFTGKFLLLIDQFEETFTLCKNPDERKTFIENLLSLADGDSESRIVITLRADFYHHCAEYESLRVALEKHQAYIGAMSQNELNEAIIRPAEMNSWDFQHGLVDLILSDVGEEPGALPLLSHALLETWKRRQGRILTLQGYHEAGGVKKAITRTAESVYERLSPAEQNIARGIFLRLTELGEGVQDTRRRVKIEELAHTKEQEAVAKVLKTLADARLVTTEHNSVEVSHEALIREWGTLRKWLDDNREDLYLHRHLTERALEWEQRGRDPSELYSTARLKRIKEWIKEYGNEFSSLENNFLKASQKRTNRENNQRAIIIGFSGFLAIMIYLAVLGQLNSFIYRPVDMEDYWITIPAGEFLMGSSDVEIEYVQSLYDPDYDFQNEHPQHTVYLDEYQIGKFEITNNQYNQCLRAGICVGSIVTERLDHPFVGVSWYEAETYCQWVGGRLPTEAEWEKAARGTNGNIYPWGNEEPNMNLLNFSGNVGNTAIVGSYPDGASPYGALDMAGNVYEWVNDWYDGSYYEDSPSLNPQGPTNANSRHKVVRGGAWVHNGYDVRSTHRDRCDPRYPCGGSFVGFRCARSP